ncbi:hypothetical protein ACFFRR_006492 [Megaselia abdita]
MEDSGIDSEDKFSSLNADFDPLEVVQSPSTVKGSDEFEVSFRSGTNKEKPSGKLNEIVSGQEEHSPTRNTNELNTCRILQRKLELKVERAKRNYYNQQQEETVKKTHTSTLIPINRLKIPGSAENEPLVDYQSDESDEPEEMSFFPVKLKGSKHQSQELSDTFSLQEMTIEDSDDSGLSQNLELLPPRSSRTFDRIFERFCCCFRNRRKWFK